MDECRLVDPKAMNDRIEKVIAARGIPKVDYARKMGCSESHVHRLITAYHPSTKMYPALAEAMGVDLDYILYGDDEPEWIEEVKEKKAIRQMLSGYFHNWRHNNDLTLGQLRMIESIISENEGG